MMAGQKNKVLVEKLRAENKKIKDWAETQIEANLKAFDQLGEKIDHLRKLVQNAYREGYHDGFTAIPEYRGFESNEDECWYDSDARECLEENKVLP